MTTGFMSCSYKIINLLKQTYHNVCIQMQIVLWICDLGEIFTHTGKTISKLFTGNILLIQLISLTHTHYFKVHFFIEVKLVYDIVWFLCTIL